MKFLDRRKDPSVPVQEEWEVLREIEFNQLARLRTNDIPEAEDLYECGSVETYDNSYDRITPKASFSLLARFSYLFRVFAR